jgi:integrase/recombinase XerD
MLEQFFKSRRGLVRMRSNVLAGLLDAYVDNLSARGHPVSTIQAYMQCVEHFGVWLRSEKMLPPDVNTGVLDRFLHQHLPACRCPSPCPRHLPNVRAALQHLLGILELSSEHIAGQDEKTPAGEVVLRYLQYLEEVCGLSMATRIYRERYALAFLRFHFGEGAVECGRLAPKDVAKFFSVHAEGLKPSSIQVMASSVRSFLRFVHVSGGSTARLVNAVPAPFNPRLAALPTVMTDAHLHVFLDSFARQEAVGLRDYAMALCLVELALRAREVSLLCLEDINWRAGLVRIRTSKTLRERLLPLSKRVGQAISSYLCDGRPKTLERRVFVRHSVPVGIALNTGQVRGAMRRAYARAGLPIQWTGTHILRRTAATRMHRQGVSLKEVADVLGHRSIDTAAIYAKVDLPTLTAVAMPWPEEAS